MRDPLLPKAEHKFEGAYDWMSKGLCAKEDCDVDFFPDRRELEALAIRVCEECPVKKECYEHGIKTKAKSGIWGGRNFGSVKGRKPKVTASAEGGQ